MQSLSNFFHGGGQAISSSSAPDHHREPDHQQLKSHLLTNLPIEIRLLIYKAVIDSWGWGPRIHIFEVQVPRLAAKDARNNIMNNKPEMKLTYFPCFHQHEEERRHGGGQQEKGVVPVDWCTGPTNRFEWRPLSKRRYLALFQTCRKMFVLIPSLTYFTHLLSSTWLSMIPNL